MRSTPKHHQDQVHALDQQNNQDQGDRIDRGVGHNRPVGLVHFPDDVQPGGEGHSPADDAEALADGDLHQVVANHEACGHGDGCQQNGVEGVVDRLETEEFHKALPCFESHLDEKQGQSQLLEHIRGIARKTADEVADLSEMPEYETGNQPSSGQAQGEVPDGGQGNDEAADEKGQKQGGRQGTNIHAALHRLVLVAQKHLQLI